MLPSDRHAKIIHMKSSDLVEFNRLRRRLTVAVVALIAITTIGVIGYAVIGGTEHGLLDAVYMTVITLTTVGFGEIVDMSASPAGRVFTLLLLLVGFAIVLYTVPLMTAFVIEGQLLNVFARRRMEKSIAAMSGHFVVTGGTSAAGHVVGEFVKTGRSVVLVVPEEAEIGEDDAGTVPFVVGDPSDDTALIDAGIERAAGFVACLESEKDNVIAVLTARRLAPETRIVATTERVETEAKLRTAGVDAVVSPSRIGGLRMASEMVRPKVVSFLDSMLRDKELTLRVEEVTVRPDASVVGQTLESLRVGDIEGAVLMALRSANSTSYEFKPPPSTTLEAGMTLIVMTDVEGRSRLERLMQGAQFSIG